MIRLIVAIGFLALNAYTYHLMANEPVLPSRESLHAFPLELGDWRCSENEPLEEKVKKNLGATDTLVCTYTNVDGSSLGFYLGYHATQIREEGGGAGENAIHPPAHCLPGSGWDIIDSQTVPLEVAGVDASNAHAKRLIIAKGEARQLVYYWYQMQGRMIAEDWQKILYVGYDRATTGRTDGALIRFTIPYRTGGENDGDAEAEKQFREFASLVTPLLPRFVPN